LAGLLSAALLLGLDRLEVQGAPTATSPELTGPLVFMAYVPLLMNVVAGGVLLRRAPPRLNELLLRFRERWTQ
jgi:hypothetical protein